MTDEAHGVHLARVAPGREAAIAFPDPAAPAPAGPVRLRPSLSRAQRLRLAAEVCDSVRDGRRNSETLLGPLAVADYPRAVGRPAALPEDARQEARRHMVMALLPLDPAGALQLLADTPNSEAPGLLLRDAGAARAGRDPARAGALLTRAIAIAAGAQGQDATKLQARSAALARRLGDPRAEALRAQAVAAAGKRMAELNAQDLPASEEWRKSQVVGDLAPADPDAAFALLAPLADSLPFDMYLPGWKAVELARHNPRRAVAELDAHPPTNSSEGERWSRAAVTLAVRLARDDAQAAVALARRIPLPAEKVKALSELSSRVPEPLAGSLRREALSSLSEGMPQSGSLVATVAGNEPDAGVRLRLYGRALLAARHHKQEPYTGWMVRMALALAPYERELARAVLEEMQVGGAGVQGYPWPATAMALLDPARALALARDTAEAGEGSSTLHGIAYHLVRAPDERLDSAPDLGLAGVPADEADRLW